uniref:Fizzy-related protein homolog n=1 Tax=Panagrellus redivivus TaxID=6233 RepID=A0A7E4VJQ9_PANRE
MNPLYRDKYHRQVLKAIVPDANPREYMSPNGSPAVTPTKYRPDGGDRYIPVREEVFEFTRKINKYEAANIDSPPLGVKPKSSAKRNLAAALEMPDPSPTSPLTLPQRPSTPPPPPSPTLEEPVLAFSSSRAATSSFNTVTAAAALRDANEDGDDGGDDDDTAQPVAIPASPPHASPYHAPPEVDSDPRPRTGITISKPIADDTYHDVVTHRALLHNELLNDNIVDIKVLRSDYTANDGLKIVQDVPQNSFFRFTNKTPTKHGFPSSSLFSTSPLTGASQRLLRSPRKPLRKISKNPYKVLDAPELQDDFYLNLVDWSSQNILSVGLNTCVYLWSACNSQVVKLCDLGLDTDSVTSVQWAEKGDYLAVGTNRGKLQIWDAHAQKIVQQFDAHSGRIGCLAWNGDLICSGSRDRGICVRDQRVPPGDETRLNDHRQEVCGLKWSPNKQYLASGGNDNQLLVWSLNRTNPIQAYTDHNAAVKALAWSPHHHGVLVSGGGTADRCLRFWNTLTGTSISVVDTGSQVCNVAWSKHTSELVSTHGYSYNHVVLWKYPQMRSVANLTGHTHRVLYLAMSPDGESIVTGAGDETLRFWHVFSGKAKPSPIQSKLDLSKAIR